MMGERRDGQADVRKHFDIQANEICYQLFLFFLMYLDSTASFITR